MTSLLSRMANEATAALSDAYGHVMHGDDAGSSARLVWVVHPVKVPIDVSIGRGGGGVVVVGGVGGGGGGISGEGGAGAEGTSGVMSGNGMKIMDDSSVSSSGKVGSPGRNANLPSSYLFTQKFDLGMTFLEVNDRAYVRTVDEGSAAAIAGIQPQDCVQFACVVGGPRFEDVEPRGAAVGVGEGSSTTPRGSRSGGFRRSARLEEQQIENERLMLDGKATGFALECEKRGMRTNYDELRDLFSGCTLPPKGDGLVDENGSRHDPMKTPKRAPNLPQDDDFTIGDSNSLMMVDSMGGLFESGRSKKLNGNVSSRCVPTFPDNKTAKNVTQSVTNVAKNAAGRCFSDADADGAEFGEGGRRSLDSRGPLLDTPISPIKSDAMISTPSPRGGGNYGDVVVEQQLYPVVMVFRRTVQRKRYLSPNKGWGSPGLSLRGSLFGVPSFRMDDECDRAAALIRQLAPSKRESSEHPDSDIFLSQGDDGESTLATNPDQGPNSSDDIEASTIRGMIQNAVGLGFVRTSKVVVGVSLQGGSGIIISRLPDGRWSAPSAIGVCGLGVGLQFGLEVADYMFILQTKEGVEHFQRGGNFAIGGNIGAAVASVGREAYGAASLAACSSPTLDQVHDGDASVANEDGAESTYYDGSTFQSNASSTPRSKKPKKKDSEMAPMVAYAKSQGLYFGVSVDGLKFFTRNDINARAYKFSMLSDMPAKDILNGLVAPPPEAEELYAALHSVEYKHEVTELPRPPDILRKDSMNDWRYDRSIVAFNGEVVENSNRMIGGLPLYSFLSTLNREEADECSAFETKFKKFMYGGVTIQRLIPNMLTRSGMTRRERRTLWLMLPEVGSLRLGLVSKSKDANGDASTMDDMTVGSSIAPSKTDEVDEIDVGNVKLSKKHSMSLTDITLLSQDPNVTVRLSPDDATEHLRIIALEDVTGKSLLFIANTNREAELLVCGLKLLLECESARLGVRGGVQLNKLGGELGKGALSPSVARGSAKNRRSGRDRSEKSRSNFSQKIDGNFGDRSKYSSIGEPGSSSDSSNNEDDDENQFHKESEIAQLSDRHQVPEGRRSWAQVPSRNHMRGMADTKGSHSQMQSPTYVLGKEIINDIETNITLPLPHQLCRALLLDSTSPVNKFWEVGRGDTDYQRTHWSFPPGSPREYEKNVPDQQLISAGPMIGAQRTVTYSRVRNRELVRLSDTLLVEKDDREGLIITSTDRMPRRGFAVRSRILLRPSTPKSCEVRIVAELRPVGKNLSDQHAVHKAFILVLDELRVRYGVEGKGLLAVCLDVCKNIPGYQPKSPSSTMQNPSSPRRPQANFANQPTPSTPTDSKKASLTSFKDVLQTNIRIDNQTQSRSSPGNKHSNMYSNKVSPQQSPRRPRIENTQERPSTPSIRNIDSKSVSVSSNPLSNPPQHTSITPADEFAEFSNFDSIPRKPMTVEVKPLPKIRLDLCPVPREEDEEEDDSDSIGDTKQKKKSKHSRRKHRSKKNR